MTANEKIKINDNKKEKRHSSIRFRQAAKILALSSANIGKYEFLTGEDILLGKKLLEKAATIKRF